jgi:hypothetical protein
MNDRDRKFDFEGRQVVYYRPAIYLLFRTSIYQLKKFNEQILYTSEMFKKFC